MLCPPGLVCCMKFISYKLWGFSADYDKPYISTESYSSAKFTIEKKENTIETSSIEMVGNYTEPPFTPFANDPDFEPNTDSAILDATTTTRPTTSRY